MTEPDYYKQMYPDKEKSPHLYQYIVGNNEMSIAESRWNYLFELALKNPEMKIALQNPVTSIWTKWQKFHDFDQELIYLGYDLHRFLLENEVVIESDYEDYSKNREASQYIGKMLQDKGLIPHYYYSGSKSIHIHIFLDFKRLLELPQELQTTILEKFLNRDKFIQSFKFWIRELMIDCWGLKTYIFDKALIKDTHLVRAELSKNKLGYKTFLGYDWNSIPLQPRICNAHTMEYPEIAVFNPSDSKIEHEIKLSFPTNPEDLIREFLSDYDEILRQQNMRSKNRREFVLTDIRQQVKFLMRPELKDKEDGFKRAMFVIANELKNIYTKEEAFAILSKWNDEMGCPFRDIDLRYRINQDTQYKITNKYIEDLIYEIGYTCEELMEFMKK